jgi:hypothetical protein
MHICSANFATCHQWTVYHGLDITTIKSLPRRNHFRLHLHRNSNKLLESVFPTIKKPPKCSGWCCRVKNNVKCPAHCRFSEFDGEDLSSLLHEIAIVAGSARTGTGRKRAVRSTITMACAQKRTRNQQLQARISQSLNSMKSWMKKEKRTRVPRNLIHHAIDQLQKLDFHWHHLDMIELRLEGRQSEGLDDSQDACRIHTIGKCFLVYAC